MALLQRTRAAPARQDHNEDVHDKKRRKRLAQDDQEQPNGKKRKQDATTLVTECPKHLNRFVLVDAGFRTVKINKDDKVLHDKPDTYLGISGCAPAGSAFACRVWPGAARLNLMEQGDLGRKAFRDLLDAAHRASTFMRVGRNETTERGNGTDGQTPGNNEVKLGPPAEGRAKTVGELPPAADTERDSSAPPTV